MQMLNRGSFMIELIVYLGLIAFIGVGAYGWFSRSQRQLLRSHQTSNLLMALYSATDLLIRDLRASPKAQTAWLKISPTTLIWHSSKADIGWSLEGNALYRIEGTYDRQKSRWVKKKRSIACKQLADAYFQVPFAHHMVDHVEVTLAMQTGVARHTIHECVYPHGEQV